jgi:hypothetical protein
VWLTQARALLNALDITTTQGLRDRAITAPCSARRCALQAVRGGGAHRWARPSGAFTPEATVAAGHANSPDLSV